MLVVRGIMQSSLRMVSPYLKLQLATVHHLLHLPFGNFLDLSPPLSLQSHHRLVTAFLQVWRIELIRHTRLIRIITDECGRPRGTLRPACALIACQLRVRLRVALQKQFR